MSFDVWKPLYVDEFDCEKYLYHYTTAETAIKIIHSNSLLFSQISKTNDTSEAKMKIVFTQHDIKDKDDYKKKVKLISEYFKQYKNIVQLLCFSVDAKIGETDKKKYISSINPKDIYYDVSGRGFALPRMWAQYASNNEGVCFIFNKRKLLNVVNHKVAFAKSDLVKYKKFFDRYLVNNEHMDELYDKISMVANGSLTLLNLIQNDKSFLKYNFFEKLDDWKSEREYRIVTLIDNKDKPNYRLPILGVSSFLEGIVIGEKADEVYEEVIKMLVNSSMKKCEIKRIRFGEQICKLD